MATVAPDVRGSTAHGDRFFFNIVATMAFVIVAAFSFHLGMGRSTFARPAIWHVHAFVFMGWVALVVTQTWLATHGSLAVHRRLGWLSAIWLPAMLVMGIAVTVATLRQGAAPFFFLPQRFLVMNVLGLVAVIALVVAAIRMRARTDWHQRLQVAAFAGLMGPAFGRLLPSPLMVPVAFESAVIAGLIFPAYAMIRERRREGRVHPAWWYGIATILGTLLVGWLVGNSPVGAALYDFAVAGSPGANVPGLAYGTPPPGM